MKQSADLGHFDVGAYLGRYHGRYVRHLEGVLQHVFAVTVPELKLAQQSDDLGIQASDSRVEDGFFARLPDRGLDLLFRPLHHVFDAGRVYAPVRNQLGHRYPGGLASDRVETRKRYRLRRVVNDQVNACTLFNRSYIPSFAAYQTTFHVVAGKWNGCDRHL